MVRTRLRARQEATREALVTNRETEKPPVREEGRSCEVSEHPPPTVEELALKAFAKVKERLSNRLSTFSSEMDTTEESSEEEEEGKKQDGEVSSQRKVDTAEGQPNVIFLETASSSYQDVSKKKPAAE